MLTRLILLGVFWIGARYTATRPQKTMATTIVLALLAFVVIVSMFVPFRWRRAPLALIRILVAGVILLLAACTNPPPSCHGPLVQMNPGEWQATPADLGMAP